MNNNYIFEIIKVGVLNNSEASIDNDIFYKCLICEGIIPSCPKEDVGCQCGNIAIDIVLHRLFIGNKEKFSILKRKKYSNNNI
ncbi:hypothetical protein [Bartonella sp. HY761]|uniref:hypothetical protein n=1 Tax=Bartonella sp. HY761 TaxID=2979330 RepID=UPI0021FE106F|nr:hypothetical protein [Bartonella sp. HY761]UXN07147.1 hypothetical protein N6A79_03820 [Bartonella sp. HY761]